MKISLLPALALYGLQVAAFPSFPLNSHLSTEELERLSTRINSNDDNKDRRGLPGLPGFNAEEQYISTSGEHQFVSLLKNTRTPQS